MPQLPGTAGAPLAAAPPPPQPPSYPSSGPGWVCLYPGCDGAPEFDAPARLRGPGDSLVDWRVEGSSACSGIYVRDEPPSTESTEGGDGW